MELDNKPMDFADWDKIVDAKLLYILFDEFECYMAKMVDEHKGEPVEKQLDLMDRLLKAVIMFTARAVATLDISLSQSGISPKNTIALTSIMHFIHAYLHTREAPNWSEMDTETDGEN